MAGLSEVLLKSAVAAILKADKFEIQSAVLAEDGEGISFNAKSKSGQVRITGIFSDPQGKLGLELEVEDENGDAPGANEPAEDDEEQH